MRGCMCDVWSVLLMCGSVSRLWVCNVWVWCGAVCVRCVRCARCSRCACLVLCCVVFCCVLCFAVVCCHVVCGVLSSHSSLSLSLSSFSFPLLSFSFSSLTTLVWISHMLSVLCLSVFKTGRTVSGYTNHGLDRVSSGILGRIV